MVAAALGLFTPIVRAEFVPVAQNLSSDSRDDRADFNQVFGQARNSFRSDDVSQNVSPAAADFSRDFTGSNAITVLVPALGEASAIQCSAIQLPDSLRIRPTYSRTAAPLSLVEDDVDFASWPRDQGWSGNGYEYRAFSAEYERLSGLEAVTLVPTPTALQIGIFGLLIVMGLTVCIRRRMRMRARQRTG
jgi:hypothetical protein